jgi:sporulation protein YlmC with PRC-barrel domain
MGQETPPAKSFLQQQAGNEWRGSKLIGTKVMGAGNKSIGEVTDLILDEKGNVQAAVIGVGGFLGMGEKNVAVPFNNLNIIRDQSGLIDHVSVPYSKEQLNSAPSFKFMGTTR